MTTKTWQDRHPVKVRECPYCGKKRRDRKAVCYACKQARARALRLSPDYRAELAMCQQIQEWHTEYKRLKELILSLYDFAPESWTALPFGKQSGKWRHSKEKVYRSIGIDPHGSLSAIRGRAVLFSLGATAELWSGLDYFAYLTPKLGALVPLTIAA